MVNCQFITGEAGTGKTTSVKTMIELDPKIALMTSTTGVSAINLGCMTVNSALKYYDTDSLRDSFVSGQLIAGIRRMVTGPDRVGGLAIDEISMMEAEQLDIIYDAFEIVSKSQDVHDDLNLILTGDFCFGLGTNILMFDGSLKKIEDIKIGDVVMGPDSMPRRVK